MFLRVSIAMLSTTCEKVSTSILKLLIDPVSRVRLKVNSTKELQKRGFGDLTSDVLSLQPLATHNRFTAAAAFGLSSSTGDETSYTLKGRFPGKVVYNNFY